MRILPGVARDEYDQADIELTMPVIVIITDSGANGLDTGSEAADTWYAVYVIADSLGINPTAGLLSTSATSPALPSGYDSFRRLGWVRNDSNSDFIRFHQRFNSTTRRMWYDASASTLRLLTDGNATSFTVLSIRDLVPMTAMNAIVNAILASAVVTDTASIRATGSQSDDAFVLRAGVATPLSSTAVQMQVPTDDIQRIDYLVSSSTAKLSLVIQGYDDEL